MRTLDTSNALFALIIVMLMQCVSSNGITSVKVSAENTFTGDSTNMTIIIEPGNTTLKSNSVYIITLQNQALDENYLLPTKLDVTIGTSLENSTLLPNYECFAFDLDKFNLTLYQDLAFSQTNQRYLFIKMWKVKNPLDPSLTSKVMLDYKAASNLAFKLFSNELIFIVPQISQYRLNQIFYPDFQPVIILMNEPILAGRVYNITLNGLISDPVEIDSYSILVKHKTISCLKCEYCRKKKNATSAKSQANQGHQLHKKDTFEKSNPDDHENSPDLESKLEDDISQRTQMNQKFADFLQNDKNFPKEMSSESTLQTQTNIEKINIDQIEEKVNMNDVKIEYNYQEDFQGVGDEDLNSANRMIRKSQCENDFGNQKNDDERVDLNNSELYQSFDNLVRKSELREESSSLYDTKLTIKRIEDQDGSNFDDTSKQSVKSKEIRWSIHSKQKGFMNNQVVCNKRDTEKHLAKNKSQIIRMNSKSKEMELYDQIQKFNSAKGSVPGIKQINNPEDGFSQQLVDITEQLSNEL
ncbi:UNKNOWN [Stylonychia lemnae]|uniref:Uncharacterized protein n=1 Tax=Stylonychia lemnae TaxID=5949 RepID=A0A078AEU9_STYLE|nr:UNKNOWN [Stylonychia lemnae]|eukprot:CDW80351.1 UNKNOWN [Stylonychia lemnae]